MTRKLPTAWDEEIDVVIVGSGFAGLAAAAEAAGAGAGVVILEKMRRYGGNSFISGGGYCSWDSKLQLRQKLNLGEDSWERHKADTLRGGGYFNMPELVEVIVQGANRLGGNAIPECIVFGRIAGINAAGKSG